jgi:WD40 repeat protein
MTIKVKDISSSNKAKELVFTGHTAPILSVSLDPKSEFLVSFYLETFQLFFDSFWFLRLRVAVMEPSVFGV